MPELPDVEGFRRSLASGLPGRRVRGVRVHDPGILRNTTAAAEGADLSPDDVRGLHTAMTRVLRTSVRHGRVPGLPRWLTGARDEPDPSCPRCGARLAHGRVGGRASWWCPRCQSE